MFKMKTFFSLFVVLRFSFAEGSCPAGAMLSDSSLLCSNPGWRECGQEWPWHVSFMCLCATNNRHCSLFSNSTWFEECYAGDNCTTSHQKQHSHVRKSLSYWGGEERTYTCKQGYTIQPTIKKLVIQAEHGAQRCSTNCSGLRSPCHDIDECNTGGHDCNTTCVNSDGSYTCSCEVGFTRQFGHCIDVDECFLASDNDCHRSLALCVNTNGSYSCVCGRGWTGDGKNCTAEEESVAAQDTMSSSGVSTGTLVGSVLAAFVVGVALCAIIVLCIVRKHQFSPYKSGGLELQERGRLATKTHAQLPDKRLSIAMFAENSVYGMVTVDV